MAENASTDGGMSGEGPGGYGADNGARGYGGFDSLSASFGQMPDINSLTAPSFFGAVPVSPSDMSVEGVVANVAAGTLSAREAERLGFGNVSLNSGQTIAQRAAAENFNNFMEQSLPTLASLVAGPAVGMFVGASKAIGQGKSVSDVLGGLALGYVGNAISTATGVPVSAQSLQSVLDGNIAKAASQTALESVAKAMGMPVGAVNAALRGDLGSVAANAVTSAVVGEMANAFGTSPAVAGLVGNSTGALAGLRNAISEQVNSFAAPANEALADVGKSIRDFSAPGKSATSTGAGLFGDFTNNFEGRTDYGEAPSGGSNAPAAPAQPAAAPAQDRSAQFDQFMDAARVMTPQEQPTAWVAPRMQQNPFSFNKDYDELVKILG